MTSKKPRRRVQNQHPRPRHDRASATTSERTGRLDWPRQTRNGPTIYSAWLITTAAPRDSSNADSVRLRRGHLKLADYAAACGVNFWRAGIDGRGVRSGSIHQQMLA